MRVFLTVASVCLVLLGFAWKANADDALYFLKPDGSVERRVEKLEKRVGELEKSLAAEARKGTKKSCPCGEGCGCCPAACPDSCPVSYEAGFERVTKGERLKLAVNRPAAAGEVQAPAIPGVKPGVYDWYARAGVPTVDVVLLPVRPADPFAVPGCATGQCAPGRR